MRQPATPFQPRPHASVCQACGQRILWVTTEKNLRQMPVDADWEYGDGHRTLMVPTEAGLWRMVSKAPEDTLGREPHFGTCPHREALRTKQPPRHGRLRLIRTR